MFITTMDQIFSHISDQIALSGSSGILLTTAITSVIPNPRPSLIRYFRQQFEEQTSLFTVARQDTDAHITAHLNLRRRALGFSPIEHPSLPQHSWVLLEAIGRAGPSGLLQSSLGSIIGLPAKLVHHYVAVLSARRLIGRRKVVCHHSPSTDSRVSVTYTSVIVLARYAAQIMEPLSQSITESDARYQRLLSALRQPPYIRAERDLKIIAIPDSERSPSTTRKLFQGQRHRHYRTLRRKLISLGIVALTKRKCVTPHGRVLGAHPCLKLLQRTQKQFYTRGKGRKVSHPLLAGGGDRFVAEVDVAEQIYRTLVEAGSAGISVPELHQYLDSKDFVSASSKRIRAIINAISKIQPITERQYFEGSAMYIRISLQGDSQTSRKRRKVGMTSLGERRQDIVMGLLQERKILIMDTLGREIALVENGPITRVDPKIMRHLITDLVAQKRVKLITIARPTIKDNPRSQHLVLVALPDVDERGDAVRNVIATFVSRSLYITQDDSRDSVTKRDGRKKATRKERNMIALSEEYDESTKDIRNQSQDSLAGHSSEEEEEEEPVIMYQTSVLDDISDDEESADEQDNQEAHSETSTERSTPVTVQKTTSSRTRSLKLSPSRKAEQGKESIKTDKKKVSLRTGQENEASKKKVHNSSRKRKSVLKRDEREIKRSKSEKKGADLKEMNVKLKKSDTAKHLTTPGGEDRKEGEGIAILIKSSTRNLKGPRILRLRALDYGCLKGKLARVRRFHRNLYEIMRARNSDDLEATPAVQHVTMESAREAAVLGRFSFLSMIKEMTVGEYAATVGIYLDHGDSIKKIEGEKIVHVLDDMHGEITSNNASRQVRHFVQTMTKLELIQSDVDSQWLLTGAGIVRDFGRGLPSGVVPHGIIFSSVKAVEQYWLELEEFSRCRMSRKPITIDLRNEENTKHVVTYPVGDLYFPKRWEIGVHRLQRQEQLIYETILQKLSGVQVVLENTTRLRTDNFIKGKLQWFNIEDFDKEMEGVMKEMLKTGKSQPPRRGLCYEQLLLYSRFRTANPIPKWFLKRDEASRNMKEWALDGKNKVVEDNSCLLQLTRTPSSIKGQQVRAAMPSVFDANHRRYFRTRTKPKLTKELPPEGRIELKRLIPLVTAILRGRAVAYHKNDAEGLDWKVIPNLARFELQQSAADLTEAVERENLRRAIVSLCEITMVRAAVDILSLKVVLRLHDLLKRTSVNENRKPWSAADVSKAAVDLVNNWSSLDAVCSAIVMEVQEDVRHHAQVCICVDNSSNLHNVVDRRSIIRKEFHMAGFMHGRLPSFTHTIEMMASRFRKVADIRLFRQPRYAILLSQPYGELTGGEGVVEDRGPTECGGIDEANGMMSDREDCANPVACIAHPSDRPATSQDASCASDRSRDENVSLSQAEKSSALAGGENKDVGAAKDGASTHSEGHGEANVMNLNRDDCDSPVVCIAHPFDRYPPSTVDPHVVVQVQDMEGVRSVNDSNFAGHEDVFSTNKLNQSLHCPPELAELVVCSVVRQPPHAQWKEGCLKLLSQFKEEDLADARDKLILRGSISVHAERERAFCCIQPSKSSQPAETMASLRGDTGDRYKWPEELRGAEADCLENTSIWRDLCTLEPSSSFATAYITSSIFFDSCGLSLVPEFEEDDEATPVIRDDDEGEEEEEEEEEELVARIKLYYQYKRGKSRGGQKTISKSRKDKHVAVKILPQGFTVMQQKVAYEIAESGRRGILLETLLRRLNPHTDDDKLAILGGLKTLLQNGVIRRFAVETNDEEWEMTTGVLYICSVHCSAITAWRTPNGEVDEQLLEWIRDEVFECILRSPGCKAEDVNNFVCAKHTSLPRRAVADIVFSLEGEYLNSSITIWQSGWKILRRRAAFVDENAIMTWGQRSIQSFRDPPPRKKSSSTSFALPLFLEFSMTPTCKPTPMKRSAPPPSPSSASSDDERSRLLAITEPLSRPPKRGRSTHAKPPRAPHTPSPTIRKKEDPVSGRVARLLDRYLETTLGPDEKDAPVEGLPFASLESDAAVEGFRLFKDSSPGHIKRDAKRRRLPEESDDEEEVVERCRSVVVDAPKQ